MAHPGSAGRGVSRRTELGRCDIALLFVTAILLGVVLATPLCETRLSLESAAYSGLVFCSGTLAGRRAEWGQAVAECNHLPADASRTRFALGCSWASCSTTCDALLVTTTLGPHAPSRDLGIAIGASALVAYGLESIRFAHRNRHLGGLLLCWQRRLLPTGLITTVLSRETEDSATVARRYGSLIGSLSGSWFFLLTSYALTLT